jgi:hypothetical protein
MPVGPLAALLVAVAPSVAACGEGPSSPAAPMNVLNEIHPAQSSAERQTGVLFDTCVRAHAVPNFPDSALKVIGRQLVFDIPADVKSNPQTPHALQACQTDLPQTSSGSDSSATLQYGLRYARCMRSHAINYPDPGLRQRATTPVGNPNAPAFRAASDACRAMVYGGSSGSNRS